MNSIAIRKLEQFPEPEFTRLNRLVFAQVSQPSDELALVLAAEGSVKQHHHAPMHRWGAYLDEELIGWSCGWMERGNVFYIANSGVIPNQRRKGIYSSLLSTIHLHAGDNDAVAVRSQHSVLNNPVIIAKLRIGYHISGLSQSAQMGTLVELTYHFSEKRHALFRSRSLPYVAPDA